jgi:hypothetical protein
MISLLKKEARGRRALHHTRRTLTLQNILSLCGNSLRPQHHWAYAISRALPPRLRGSRIARGSKASLPSRLDSFANSMKSSNNLPQTRLSASRTTSWSRISPSLYLHSTYCFHLSHIRHYFPCVLLLSICMARHGVLGVGVHHCRTFSAALRYGVW